MTDSAGPTPRSESHGRAGLSTPGAPEGSQPPPRPRSRGGLARRARAIPHEFRVEAALQAIRVASPREREILSECLIEWASPTGRRDHAASLDRSVEGAAWLPAWIRDAVAAPLRWRRERALTRRDEAVRAIASAWELIPKEHTALAVAACADRFDVALAGLGTAADPQTRRSLAVLVGEMGLAAKVGMLELLATLVPDRDERVSDAAHASLLRLAIRAGLDEISLMGPAGEGAWGVVSGALAAIDPQWRESEWREMAAQTGGGPEAAVRVAQAVSLALRSGGRSGNGGRDLAVAALIAARAGEPERIVLAGAGVRQVAGESTSAALSAVRGALRSSRMPLAALRAVRWLTVPSLRRAAIDRLVSMDAAPELGLALAHSHLLLRASRGRDDESAARALRGAGARDQGGPGTHAARAVTRAGGSSKAAGGASIAGVGALGTRAKLGLWRFLEWRGDGAPARTASGVRLLADRDPIVRHAAARSGTRGLALDLVFDVSEQVARHAFLRTSAAGSGVLSGAMSGATSGAMRAATSEGELSAVLARLERSPHASVRTMAIAERDVLGMAAGGLAARVRVRRWIAVDRAEALRKIASDLGDGGLEACERAAFALRIAADAGVVFDLREAILVCVDRWQADASPEARRLVAGLATLLGDVPTRDAAATAITLTTHQDARVGANAVEALARQERLVTIARQRGPVELPTLDVSEQGKVEAPTPLVPALASRFEELRADPRHRVRANAIRAMIEGPAPTGSEVESLVAMIEDPRPAHRLAGAWVLWRELPSMASRGEFPRWSELAARAVRLQSFDVDARVRRRAGACVARLSMATGGAWEGAA